MTDEELAPSVSIFAFVTILAVVSAVVSAPVVDIVVLLISSFTVSVCFFAAMFQNKSNVTSCIISSALSVILGLSIMCFIFKPLFC